MAVIRARRTPGPRPRLFDSMHVWPLLGVDEVGTGCAAGPIAAAGVVLPRDEAVLDALSSARLNDSKQMTETGRARARDIILAHATFHAVEFIHPRELEELGQSRALDKMFNAIMGAFRTRFGVGGSIVLDGERRPLEFKHIAVHQGDSKSFTVAAASVLAKVARDELMCELAKTYPGYDLASNKGYLTPKHFEGLEKLGASDIHRRNVKPVQAAMESYIRSGRSPSEEGGSSPPAMPEVVAASTRPSMRFDKPRVPPRND